MPSNKAVVSVAAALTLFACGQEQQGSRAGMLTVEETEDALITGRPPAPSPETSGDAPPRAAPEPPPAPVSEEPLAESDPALRT